MSTPAQALLLPAPPGAVSTGGLPSEMRAVKRRFRWLRTERWTLGHVVVAAVMAGLGVLATLDAWRDIFHIAWRDGENNHVFLVPIVAGWMIFARRFRFRHCKPSGTMTGLMVVCIGWVISTFGYYHGYQALFHGGAVLVALGGALSVLGRQALFRYFPAIAVLVFLIPVMPHHRLWLAHHLELWTGRDLQGWNALISEHVLNLCGVPVERHGSLLVLSVSHQSLNIVEACNGLRMVFSLILVTYAFSFGLPLRNSVRLIVLALSPVIAIFCNVLRIIPTVWVYGHFSRSGDRFGFFGGTFHDLLGWLMLPLAFLILLGIIKLLRWAMVPVMQYTLAS